MGGKGGGGREGEVLRRLVSKECGNLSDGFRCLDELGMILVYQVLHVTVKLLDLCAT